jgi:O-succinylbenzoic acid--CoA ligase
LKVSASHIFISTPDSEITYGQLSEFRGRLWSNYVVATKNDTTTPVLLLARKDIQTALVISTCFLSQIPLVIIPADSSEQRIQQVFSETKSSSYFGSKSNLINTPGLINIRIPAIGPNTSTDTTIEVSNFDLNKLFAVLYTSGTTSIAKAVPIRFKQILSAAKNSAINLPLDTNDEWLLNLPLHHIGGVSVLTRSILSGSKVYLNPAHDTHSLSEIFRNRNSLTHASLVPTQLKRLLDDPDFKLGSKFKAILLGGGPISPLIHRSAKERNIPVIPSFGMTETAAQCISVPTSNWSSVPDGTSGIPLNGIKLSLRMDSDNNSNTLLWIKGNQVFDGYCDTTLNQLAIDPDGWFNTGDYARIDENGYVFIEMRRADRIVTGGENVNPIAIEELLESHDSISEAAVFGVPDEEWGQQVVAAIVTKKNVSPVGMNQLKDYLKNFVPGFMIPKRFILVKQLPRTASGKLIRSELSKIIPD